MRRKRKKRLLWIYILITTALFSCVQDIDPQTSNTVPSSPPPIVDEPVKVHIPITGDIDDPANDKPVIKDIQFPDTVISQVESAVGFIHFSDAEGDIYSAQFTCTDCGCMDFEFFAFDPTTALDSGDRFDGIFRFRQSCACCPDSQGDRITMQVQLFDRAGNTSLPAEYQFSCQ